MYFFPKIHEAENIFLNILNIFCDQINKKNQQNRVTLCPGQRVLSNNRDQRFSVDFLLIRTQNFY
jgi:hypothetical protein